MLTILFATSAHAQLNGENLLGDMGVKSGTQPEPGLYVSTITMATARIPQGCRWSIRQRQPDR